MFAVVMVLSAVLLALMILGSVRRGSASRHAPVARSAARVARPLPARLAAGPGTAPRELAPLAWEDPVPAPAPLEGEELRLRLRDRYIAARFPGIAECVADLERIDNVIRGARLCFEEERYDQADELLEMAIERSPGEERLRLARIEISFLRREVAHFVALARELRREVPDSRHWSEVARLGRAIAPAEPLFEAGPGSRPHENYGPWPDMPNWIQASWDLTAEVLAGDFRRAILHGNRGSRSQADQRLIA